MSTVPQVVSSAAPRVLSSPTAPRVYKATGICFVALRRAFLPRGSGDGKGAMNGQAIGTSRSPRLPQGLG